MSAVLWQRIEGALILAAALFLLFGISQLGVPGWSWWVWLILFFAPDLSFAAYALGPKVGAAAYNLVHLYGVWFVVAALGLGGVASPTLGALGLLWLAHAGFDRLFGYGLKEVTGFTDTHLGVIGKGRR